MEIRGAVRCALIASVGVLGLGAAAVSAQGTARSQGTAAANALPSLALVADWRQRSAPPNARADFVLEGGVTPEALTNEVLAVTFHDPGAQSVASYRDHPPPRSRPGDWGGPTCIQLAGYNQDDRPARVAAGQPTDPPNLWTGVCQTPVAVTFRDKGHFLDLTGLARIRWVTRTSGFHVVRPVVKLADGSWFVGDYGEGAASTNSTLFLQSELPISSVRWLPLDIARVVTVGQSWAAPDLSRVDEIGFADLIPGSGHGWGGFVNVGRFEVYARTVDR